MKPTLTRVLLLAGLFVPVACKSDGAAKEPNARIHLGVPELEFRSVFGDAELVNEGPDWKVYRVELARLSVWGERGSGFVTTMHPHDVDFVFRNEKLVEYRTVH